MTSFTNYPLKQLYQKMTNFRYKTVIFLFACVYITQGNLIPPDAPDLQELCAAFRAPEISGVVLCPTGMNGVIAQQSCDKHCQCAHAANFGNCSADPGTSEVYCHCLYTPAPAGQPIWNNSDAICAAWSNIAVTVLCDVTQNSVIPPIGFLAPLCYLDCPCIHKIITPNFGTCGPHPVTGQQKCFCDH